jgi:hypothetical protein
MVVKKERKWVMTKYPPLRKMLFAIAPAVVVALGSIPSEVMADSLAQQTGDQFADLAAYSVVKHRRHAARGEFVHGFGDDAPIYNSVAPIVPAYREPGYAYGPGRGVTNDRNLEGYPRPAD